MRRALLLLALAACTDDPASSGPNVTSHVSSYELPPSMPPSLDLLFVVGDTTNYDLTAIPGIVDDMVEIVFGGFPDVRISTTSSSDILELQTGLFGEHTQSFTGSLAEALSTRLAPGNTQVLSRMASSLDFIRDAPYLGIITINATDDTSADADYAAMVKAKKTDPASVVVSGIYKRPAPRLDAFHDAFPNRNSFTSIDSADLSPAFDLVLQLPKTTLGVPCAPMPLDLDPETAGNQFDCAVSAYDGMNEIARVPACGGSDPAMGSCWEVVPNAACTDANTGELRLRGDWHRYHPKVRWECVTR